MDTETSEEEEAGTRVRGGLLSLRVRCWHLQEWYPRHVLHHGVEDVALSQSVLEEREPEVACTGEDYGACKPDLEALEIEAIHLVPPAE